jgi:hypothetical protein
MEQLVERSLAGETEVFGENLDSTSGIRNFIVFMGISFVFPTVGEISR